MSRYTTLYKTPENLYTENSPVIISAGALLKDNDTNKILVQLKFRNIYDKTIKAVKIEIIPYSVDKEELTERTESQYLDLTASYNTEFGQKQPVFLPDNTTRLYDVLCKSVIFVDGTKWENTNNAPFISTDYPQGIRNKINETENFRQFIDFAIKEDIKENTNIFWQKHDKQKLINQNNELSSYTAYATGDLLENTNKLISNFQAILTAERKADEDFSEDELKILSSFDELKKTLEKTKTEITNDKKQKTKKRIKFSAVIISILAVIVLTILLITTLIIPTIKYNNAITLLEQKKYPEAIEILTELKDFKDSPDKLSSAKNSLDIINNKEKYEQLYSEATELLNGNDYLSAYNKFCEIKIYKDSKEKINEIIASINQEITKAINEKKYVYARQLLTIPGVNNAELYKTYINAKLTESDSIIKAYEYYKNLPSDFLDTSERVKIIEKYLPYTGTFYLVGPHRAEIIDFSLNENDEVCFRGMPIMPYTDSNEFDYYYFNAEYDAGYISKNEVIWHWVAYESNGEIFDTFQYTYKR